MKSRPRPRTAARDRRRAARSRAPARRCARARSARARASPRAACRSSPPTETRFRVRCSSRMSDSASAIGRSVQTLVGGALRRARPAPSNGFRRPYRCLYCSSSSSVIPKNGPRSVANTDSSSSGRSIGGERGAKRLDLGAVVKRSAADEQVRHAARFQRVDVGARDVRLVAHEPPEQDADVPRLDRHERSASHLRLPAALGHEPLDVGADRVRQRLLDRRRRDALRRVRLRHRQHDDGGLIGEVGPHRAEARRSPAAAAIVSPVIAGANAALIARWMFGRARKLVCSVTRRAPAASSCA